MTAHAAYARLSTQAMHPQQGGRHNGRKEHRKQGGVHESGETPCRLPRTACQRRHGLGSEPIPRLPMNVTWLTMLAYAPATAGQPVCPPPSQCNTCRRYTPERRTGRQVCWNSMAAKLSRPREPEMQKHETRNGFTIWSHARAELPPTRGQRLHRTSAPIRLSSELANCA